MTSRDSIVDASKPNSGRIYDYLLGGHHNFEVDRMAAEQVVKLLPFVPKFVRLQRWCLQDIAVELTEKRGYNVIIDFASGLPTNDHIHYVVPAGTTVIYSDYDPVVVEYAREILADTPNVHFFLADARQPEELLNRAEVQEILKGRRDVALVTWGVASFLSDEDLAHMARVLYDWTGAAAVWAFNAMGSDVNQEDPAVIRVKQIYKSMGQAEYARTLVAYQDLVAPWHADAGGFISLLQWHGMTEREMTDEDRQAFGAGGGGYGAYLVK
jgi:hypothetical protein